MHEGHWVSYFTVSWMTRDMGVAADERMTVLIIFFGWQYLIMFELLDMCCGCMSLMLRERVGSTGKCDSNGWQQLCFVCMYVWFYMFMCPLSYRHLYVKFTVISHKNKNREKETALSCLWSRASFFSTWTIGCWCFSMPAWKTWNKEDYEGLNKYYGKKISSRLK